MQVIDILLLLLLLSSLSKKKKVPMDDGTLHYFGSTKKLSFKLFVVVEKPIQDV